MYGYEQQRPAPEPGGCRDSLVLIRVAFEVLLPIVSVGIGSLGLIALTIVLFSTNFFLGLIPVAIGVGALVWLGVRDKRTQREKEREVRGE